MSDAGKVKVVVRSRKVPLRTVEFATHPIFPVGTYSTPVSSPWNSGLRRERVVVYESVLDDEQRRAIDEGQRLARNLGLELEVVDESKFGLLKRVRSSLGGISPRSFGVTISPSANESPLESPPAFVKGS
jgi:hypothetical protein